MLQVCYALILTLEMLAGVWAAYSLYPEFRKKGKWIQGIGIFSCAVLCIVYVVNGLDSFISNISVLLIAVIFSAVYCIFFKADIFKVFLLEMIYLVNISFLKLPVLILEGVLLKETLYAANRGDGAVKEWVWCVVWSAVIILAVRKRNYFKFFLKNVQLLITENIRLLFFLTGVQWLLLSYNMWLGRPGFQMMNFIFSVILVSGTFLCLLFLILKMAYDRIKTENICLDISQGLLERQNDELREMYEKDRRRLHEHYHSFEYVYYCICEEKIEAAKEFLSEYLMELDEKNRQTWTGLPFLDFIINYKKQIMDTKDITFKLKLDVYEYPFEEPELGILLGNLLDNAIEACEKCESAKREISLRIWNVKCNFMLHLLNSSSKSPELKGEQFITDKENKNEHGMGVEQVRRIIEKYDGDVSFQHSRESFEVKIIVPITKEGKE